MVMVFALLVGVSVGYVVKGRKSLFDVVPDRWDWLLEAAVQIAVKAAEQLYNSEESGKKLAFAIQYVTNYLEKMGVIVDPAIIRGAIEAAVHDLKNAVESE